MRPKSTSEEARTPVRSATRASERKFATPGRQSSRHHLRRASRVSFGHAGQFFATRLTFLPERGRDGAKTAASIRVACVMNGNKTGGSVLTLDHRALSCPSARLCERKIS